MSSFFELFEPGLRYLREQRDLEKVLVVDPAKGADGLGAHDLESGVIVLKRPLGSAVNPADATMPSRATRQGRAGGRVADPDAAPEADHCEETNPPQS